MPVKPKAAGPLGEFEQFALSLPLQLREFLRWLQTGLPAGTTFALQVPQGTVAVGDFTIEYQGLAIRRTSPAPRKSP